MKNGNGKAKHAVSEGFQTGRSGNGFLDALPERVVQKLKPHLRSTTLTRNTYLFQQDETPEWVYFPISSIISRYQILEDGRTIEVALTGSESAVGIAASLGAQGSVSCCQVCIGGKAYKIFRTYLTDALRGESAVNRMVVEHMESQIKQISKRLVCSHFHPVEQRLCAWLLLLHDRRGGGRLEVTHDQTARSLGIHRPTVTAITKDLRARGLISYARGGVTICDIPNLKELACDCYVDFIAA